MTTPGSEQDQPSYTRKDFISDLDIRWCSGCGDYFIHQALTQTFANMGRKREDFLVVSGIGCSSRFPYYLQTYGFHTIHGRAPTVALGAKLANPELSVWVITGDGDGLSIGGNHLLHLIRRNPDINVILFNNEIYGLTKGQASPTSKLGQRTKSSPMGTLERPLNPLRFALSAGATFVARVVDTNPAMMKDVFRRASEHKGLSFVEAYTTCVIFNDGVFDPFEKRSERADHTVELRHGEPLIYGKKKDKGIILDEFHLKSVGLGEGGTPKEEILVHDAHRSDPVMALFLARMEQPELPLPVGVFYENDEPAVYEEQVLAQEKHAVEQQGRGDLAKLLYSGEKWQVD